MQDVTEIGTAKFITKIPGINVCAKTGTAQNKRVLDKKVVEVNWTAEADVSKSAAIPGDSG